jgi:hypothetical protein
MENLKTSSIALWSFFATNTANSSKINVNFPECPPLS